MEFPITIFLIPVVGLVVGGMVALYFACKPYWEEQDKRNQPPVDSDVKR